MVMDLDTRKANARLPVLQGVWQPKTVDAESRTVDVVFTTGADTKRGGVFEPPYIERLRVSPDAVDLTRLNNGAPLLDSHEQRGVRNMLGSVERAWIENGQGQATVRFSKRAEVEPVWQDVVDGVLRGVSVGYSRDEVTQTDEEVNGLPVREVTRWTPAELSFVSAPADSGAQVRTLNSRGVDEPMTEQIETRNAPGGVATPQATDDVEKAERKRASEILMLCERSKLPVTFARSLIADGASLDAAREAVVDAIAERDEGPELNTKITPGGSSCGAGYAAIAAAAIQHRSGLALTDNHQALALASRGMQELTRRAAEVDGIYIPETASRTDVWKRALTSATLGEIVALTASRSITRGYDAEPRVFTRFARRGSAANFRNIERIKISDAPKLEEVPEGDPYPLGDLSDSKETFKLATYAKVIMYTRQLWINDDVDALTRLPQMLGAAAASTENDVFWAFVNGNSNMADGLPLFDASNRKNLVFSSALSAPALEAARAHFRGVTTEKKRR